MSETLPDITPVSSTKQGTPWKKIIKYVCTHNPFYVVSAAMVLYGLQRAFSGPHTLDDGWLLLQVLCGYTGAMAVAAIIVVRGCRVWDDARMMLLLLVLLFGAISMSFDLFALTNPVVGLQMLSVGFVFAVVLTELVLFALKLRLDWRYRIPFYIQLLLLFGYPAWLAELSFTGQNLAMHRFVALFPTCAAVSLLALWPAAYLSGENERPAGAPWKAPWYPWTMFFFIGLGFAVRSYSLTISFENSLGLRSGFRLYFLLPLLLAGAVLFFEVSTRHGWWWLRRFAVVTPIGMLVFAFPVGSLNSMQARYLHMLTTHALSPAIIYLLLLVLFYGWLLLRGEKWAEFGVVFSLLALALVAPEGGLSLRPTPWAAPFAILILLELVIGIRRGSSFRIITAAALVTLGSLPLLDGSFWTERLGLVPIAILLNTVWLVGIAMEDRLALFLRQLHWTLPVMMAFYAVMLPIIYVDQAILFLAILYLGLSTAILYWYGLRRQRDLLTVVIALVAIVGAVLEWASFGIEHNVLHRGRYWLAAGGMSLIAGVCVSMAKGGVSRQGLGWLAKANRFAHGERAEEW